MGVVGDQGLEQDGETHFLDHGIARRSKGTGGRRDPHPVVIGFAGGLRGYRSIVGSKEVEGQLNDASGGSVGDERSLPLTWDILVSSHEAFGVHPCASHPRSPASTTSRARLLVAIGIPCPAHKAR